MTPKKLGALSALVLSLSSVPFVAFAQVDAIRAGVTSAANTAGLQGACAGTGATGGTECVMTIIGNVIRVAVGFLGILLLGYLLYAGFLYMTSGGETEGVKKAKTMIENAVIGLIIIACAFAISSFILENLASLTGDATTPTPTPTPQTR